MYVVLKPKYGWNTIGEHFKSHTGLKLPASCRITHINIQNDFKIMDLNCCRNLNIFNDVNKSNGTNSKDIRNSDKIECDEERESKTEPESNVVRCPSDCNNFYECKIIVKGFKDQLIKGQSIWTNNL